jgi:hypothetical protein
MLGMAGLKTIACWSGALMILSACLTASAGQAQNRNQGYPYSIMAPEPGTFPGVIPPRRSMAHPLTPSKPPRRRTPSQPRAIPQAPPPIVVPGLGTPVPSLQPVPRGSVPGGGAETFSDRAIRCSQQSSMFNVPTTSAGSYMHSCSMGP